MALAPVLHDLGRAELVAAVHDGDLAGELGEKRGFLHGRVAAAHHDELLVLEEEPVTSGARGDPVSHQPGLGLEPQQLGGGAGGDDQGIAGVAVLAGLERHGPCAELHRGDVAENDPGAEALGLLAELVHHVRAHDAVGETGIVLDVGGDGELAPGLGTLHHQRREVGTGRVEGGGESGRPRTEDDDGENESGLSWVGS